MKKLQALLVGLAIAVSGGAFARDVTVIRHGDGDVTRVVRHGDGDVTRIVRHRDERDFGRMRVMNPGHHYGWYHNHRRVVFVRPAHRHHHFVSRRTVIVRHYG